MSYYRVDVENMDGFTAFIGEHYFKCKNKEEALDQYMFGEDDSSGKIVTDIVKVDKAEYGDYHVDVSKKGE